MPQGLVDGPIPLYYQLKELLKKHIQANDYNSGDQLPSERELEERYGVSRMTARRALVELENEGFVKRKRGKGTFVTDAKYRHYLVRLTSFTEESKSQNLRPGAQVLAKKTVYNDVAYQKMNLQPEPLIYFQRIRTINDEPVAFENTYLRAEYCPGLEQVDLNNASLYSYLTKSCKISLGKAIQTIEARKAEAEDARILQIDPGEPVFYLERITHLKDSDLPIEYVEAVYRSDKYKFMVEMQR